MAVTVLPDEAQQEYGDVEVADENPWAGFLRYPILFETAVQDENTNGIGALSDTITATVTRTINQFPVLQLTYKRDGVHAKELKEGRIIMVDMGPDLVHQKFRINQVTKSEQNIVVNAAHIAGDIAYNTITQDIQVPSASADDVFNLLINNLASPMSDIRFDTDVTKMVNVNFTMSDGNAGNYLITPDEMGDDYVQSMVGLFGGEWVFDNYHYIFKQHAGRETGRVIKYGRDLKTISQDTNIADTYTALYPYAKYTPAPPKATLENEDWTALAQDYASGVATVTYAAGGVVDVYDAPVEGHHIIRQIKNGSQVRLGKKISDGTTLDDHKVVNTVNGDDWYALADGGWINSRWLNFDKTGDYLVTNSVGHSTVKIDDSDAKEIKYPFDGVAVVDVAGKYINFYRSPFLGPEHVTTGKIANGYKVHVMYKAINQNGDVWYCHNAQHWLYGPHLSFKKDGAYTVAPTKGGKGYVTKDAQKYVLKDGKVYKASSKTKTVSSRTKKASPYKTVINKKTGKKEKVKNPAYTKSTKKTVKATIPKGTINLSYGQIQIGDQIYYKTGNGNTLIKADDVSFKKPGTHEPSSIETIQENEYTNGKVEMYSEPSFKGKHDPGTAMNWSIPAGVSLSTGAQATGDGETWTQVTYAGKTGWVLTKYLQNVADDDFDPYNPDDLESSDDTQTDDDTDVDSKDITVTLPEGTLYSQAGAYEEMPRVQNYDLSSMFVHDYQDESGLDPTTGEYHATDADVEQLRRLANGYMEEQRFGYPVVSLTLDAENISKLDLNALALYDFVTVDFEQLDISERAEVTTTVWDCMAQRYTQITIGQIEPTYEHLLLQKAADDADKNLASARADDKADNVALIGRYRRATQLEGEAKEEAMDKLFEEMGLYRTYTDKNGKTVRQKLISMQTFEDRMDDISNDVSNVQNWIESGGNGGVIHAYPDWNAPTELYAVTEEGGKMKFNAHGLEYVDRDGTARTAIASNGEIVAEHISSGTITALNMEEGTIHGSLHTGTEGGMQVYIGTNSPTTLQTMQPSNGGKGMWVTSPNYNSMISSGRITVDNGSGYASLTGEGLYVNGTYWKSIVKSWIRDTITINKKTYKIWEG